MDFDPAPTVLRTQEDVDKYLEKHRGPWQSGIKVEWYPPMNVQECCPNGGVYFHPQILALGVRLPLIDFVCKVLAF